MTQKKLGVLGGMGPKATSVFFEKVIENTAAYKDQDHIDMIILNHASISDRTEVLLEKRENDFLKEIEKNIKYLELADVSNIVIPCNTAHYFIDKIQKMTNIHVINMVRETVKEVYNIYGKGAKVGILATDGTINCGTYQNACLAYNLDPYIPTSEVQEIVMDVIYTDVKSHLVLDGKRIESIIHDLIYKENCQCVILACTELSCLTISEKVSKYYIDAMDVLVKNAIEKSGKKVKNTLIHLTS